MTPYADPQPSATMPTPDQRILYSNNMFGPAMFHSATEDADPIQIAKSHGFDISLVTLEQDLPGDHPLILAYEDGECDSIFAAWQPKPPGEGWTIAGCHDTDEGPVAIFLRKIS